MSVNPKNEISMDDIKKTVEQTQITINSLNEAVRRQNKIFEDHVDDDRKIAEMHIGMLQKVSEQVRETQECVIKLDNKLDLNIQKLEYELKSINELDERQNAMLDEHIRRTAAAEARIEVLEEPRKAVRKLVEWSKWIMAIGGAIAILSKFLG